jgi:hypothetical protein
MSTVVKIMVVPVVVTIRVVIMLVKVVINIQVVEGQPK